MWRERLGEEVGGGGGQERDVKARGRKIAGGEREGQRGRGGGREREKGIQ